MRARNALLFSVIGLFGDQGTIEEVIDIFAAAGLKKPDISILSDAQIDSATAMISVRPWKRSSIQGLFGNLSSRPLMPVASR